MKAAISNNHRKYLFLVVFSVVAIVSMYFAKTNSIICHTVTEGASEVFYYNINNGNLPYYTLSLVKYHKGAQVDSRPIILGESKTLRENNTAKLQLYKTVSCVNDEIQEVEQGIVGFGVKFPFEHFSFDSLSQDIIGVLPSMKERTGFEEDAQVPLLYAVVNDISDSNESISTKANSDIINQYDVVYLVCIVFHEDIYR